MLNSNGGFFILKKFAVWALAFALVITLAFTPGLASTKSSIKLVVDGQEVKLDAQPTLEDGRILIPLRGLFEQAGLRVDWDGAKKAATVTNGYTTIVLKENTKQAQVDGKNVNLDVAAKTQNGRMYIPARFIAETVGFKVDYKSEVVNITTNRVKDTDAFIQKSMETDLNSYSATMNIDQTMRASSMADAEMKMSMRMKMDATQNPLALYMKMSMDISMDGEKESIPEIESYFTNDGFYQFDPMSSEWVKYDDELMQEMLEELMNQADPLSQFEELRKYLKNIQVYEYADHYIMSFSLADNYLNEMMGGLGDLLGEEIGELPFKVNYFEFSTKLDKKTLYPIDLVGKSHLYGDIEGEKLNIYQSISGKYSNYNKINEITIPEDVLKNAKSFEEMYSDLGL